MTMLVKPVVSAYFSLLRRVYLLPARRFLPQAYYCDDLWDARLAHFSLKNNSARDLGVSILQAINSNRPVSPLDYDTFANKIHELDVVSTDFIENIIERYAHTQSAVEVIDSTTHAIVRAYLKFQKYQNLLDLAKRRGDTGLFFDPISANMFADHLVDHEEWHSVVEVMWELCLQNYFHSKSVSPIAVSFALLSGLRVISELPEEEPPVTVPSDSDDVQYVFVPYVRNPNYDGFFDIERLRLKLGFLWLHILDLIDSRPQSIAAVPSVHQTLDRLRSKLAPGLKLFGLSLSEQIDRLKSELSKLTSAEQLATAGLSANVLEKLSQVTESARTREDKDPIERGKPIHPTKSEVASALAQIQQLAQLAKPLSEDFLTSCDTFARDSVLTNQECLDREIESVRSLYEEFNRTREANWSARMKKQHQETVLRRVKETLRELTDEEEKLRYFKNSEEIYLRAWLAPRTRREKQWTRLKDWREDISRHHQKQQNDGHEA